MHWSEVIARRALEKVPVGESVVIGSGISLSGPVHVGHSREFLTAALIAHAVERNGGKARLIAFVDDMDPLRKVYPFLPPEYSRWVGHLWQKRYKSQAVGKDEYFLQCGKYIELNPVWVKLTQSPADYPYSSYRFYVKAEQNPLITEDPIYQELSDDIERRKKIYRELVISEVVLSHYKHKIWVSNDQRYNEDRKSKRKARLLKEVKLNTNLLK